MVSSVYLSSMNLATFNSTYRFNYTEKSESTVIETATMKPTMEQSGFFQQLTLDQFNQELLSLEEKDTTAVLMNMEEQPMEINKLLSRVAGGKYGQFVKRHLDYVVFGRNFEKINSAGSFQEDLGASAGNEVSEAVTGDSEMKLGFVDTYNSIFNSLASKTSGDKIFTRYAQVISVFTNELKQAYFQSKGKMKEDAEVYTYLKEALEDVQKDLDAGNTFGFIRNSEKEIFGMAVGLMIDNVDTYLTDLKPAGRVTASFTGIA